MLKVRTVKIDTEQALLLFEALTVVSGSSSARSALIGFPSALAAS